MFFILSLWCLKLYMVRIISSHVALHVIKAMHIAHWISWHSHRHGYKERRTFGTWFCYVRVLHPSSTEILLIKGYYDCTSSGLVHWTQVLVLPGMWVRIPGWPVAALVSLSNTLNHNCFVLRMGRKAVGAVCCVMHVKEPRTLIVKEKGLAPVFLDSRLEHPAGWICARYKSYHYYYYYY